MRRFLPLLIVLTAITPTFVFSQSTTQQWEWARSFGGNGTDSSVDIKLKNGYLYVTGTFTSSQINWGSTTLTNAGGKDIFIAKLDTNGNTIWVKNFGGAGDDRSIQLEVNSSGTSAVWCTSTSNSIVIGSNILTNSRNFYIELDKDGNILNSNKQAAVCNYQDFEIDTEGAVYLSGSYLDTFTFAGSFPDTVFTTQFETVHTHIGGIIFKYNADGTEAWVKYIPLYVSAVFPSVDPPSPTTMKIEYTSSDNSLSFIFSHYGTGVGDFSHFGPPSAYQPQGSKEILSGKFSDTTLLYAANGYSVGGSLNGYVLDFEKGNANGLNFSFYDVNLLSRIDYGLQKDYDLSRQIDRSWSFNYGSNPSTYTGDVVDIVTNTLRTSESGDHIVFNNNSLNKLEILDTSLVSKKSIIIPTFGTQQWNAKEFNNTGSMYFADTYSNSSLLLNQEVQGGTTIPLNNNGSTNIFIGKYNTSANPPLTLVSSPNRIKVCSDSITMALSMLNAGNGKLTYHWQPASFVSDTSILNPKVYIQTDSAILRLTISDTTGASLVKDFTFYKGTPSAIKLVASDTVICKGNYVILSLQGTPFNYCYVVTDSNQTWSTARPFFYNVYDNLTYRPDTTSTISLHTYTNSLLQVSPYCLFTDPVRIVVTNNYGPIQYDTICQGSSYVFPDGKIINNVRESITYTSKLHGVVCDSLVITQLAVNKLPVTETTLKVCNGSSITLADGTLISNVQADTSYTINLGPAGQCDTATIRTIIQVVYPVSSIKDTIICKGSSFTFPDDSTIANIQASTSYISHLQTIYGCDSTITTNVNLYPSYSSTSSAIICPGSSYTFPDDSVMINISAPVTYISHLASVNGCDSSITTNISLYPVNESTKNVTVCAGASYTFANDTTISNITAQFTHTSHFSAANGCDSIINYNVTVINVDTAVTKSGRLLTANLANANYQWLNCANTFAVIADSVNRSFSASVVGEYAVEITSQGCVDTSNCYVITPDDVYTGGRMVASVYPVPSTNTFKVKITVASSATVNLILYDVFGNKISLTTVSLQPGENTVSQNIANLTSGTYTLQLVNTKTGETITKRIIKN